LAAASKIDHAGSMVSIYGHLSEIVTGSAGWQLWLAFGEMIGRVGSSGLSTGSHLHFAIEKDGQFRQSANRNPSASTIRFRWQCVCSSTASNRNTLRRSIVCRRFGGHFSLPHSAVAQCRQRFSCERRLQQGQLMPARSDHGPYDRERTFRHAHPLTAFYARVRGHARCVLKDFVGAGNAKQARRLRI